MFAGGRESSHLRMPQGSKKGGGAQKKGGSSIADLLKKREPYEETATIMQNLLLIENHRRKVGRQVAPAGHANHVSSHVSSQPRHHHAC